MDCLIIYCHPYDKSFNHAIFENIKENLERKNKSYKVIDLYKDSFVPYYDLEEMRLFHTGQTHDPLVKRYLSWLKETSEVIFITPFWWNGIPGMLKGFFDKVMKEGEGLSHTVTKTGIHGELTNVKHTYVFTTSTSPTFYLKLFLGNGIKRIFINKTLKQLGMQDCHWYNFGGVSTSSVDRRKKYLEKILKINL
ncbi:MAG: NAD(P)H-dependent oxidoreductase [Lactobacillus crispatus]|jgi:putative NADPH-quinone reductase|uniref:NAD(P)H-dependent oxidoreductase n=1 Tax=Lactobacillus crispatus TaxID=47770 RepID=UPI0018A946FD|nr:NAD(P)H-dependent oxidoreductase [Lactobacillus crispatus]MCH4003860.1 NAD(P)H-dependent oxidoreductase [Lactobacillus crispatus]MCI1334960.1 NAD(P)H-dependent oxidoreductase [Lactobacillus crispatus]MCI1365644.1 NAD(P)H-dependent oxidoreductase [Lactobacillus crispatus]MCI1493334.1 NAD(P)H-dependent oxidoreductase [Lactobacillus crispatus]MCI1523832.1 NAD(P)H-dependent oxidoreductase [Lactobacillus crispatus]